MKARRPEERGKKDRNASGHKRENERNTHGSRRTVRRRELTRKTEREREEEHKKMKGSLGSKQSRKTGLRGRELNNITSPVADREGLDAMDEVGQS